MPGDRIGDLLRARAGMAGEVTPSPWMQALPGMIKQLGGVAMDFQQNRAAQKQQDEWSNYAKAYDDYLRFMRPGGIGF